MKARRVTRAVISTLALTLGCVPNAVAGVCEAAKGKVGLSAFGIGTEPDEEGNVRIRADLDGDAVADTLLWFRTGSASLIPADNSSATINLSSTGKSYTIEDQHVMVAKYMGKYYVLTASLKFENGPWKKTVYSVGHSGISKLCSFAGRGIGPWR